jgi:acyl-CoA reductase-like NAD-dependent aldehyde dehydrogenase
MGLEEEEEVAQTPYEADAGFKSSASTSDALNAVSTAQTASGGWRAIMPGQKRNLFWKAAEVIESRSEELIGYMRQETNSNDDWGYFNISLAAEILRDVAGRISGLVGAVPVMENTQRSAIVWKEPYGVILGIAPWYVEFRIMLKNSL